MNYHCRRLHREFRIFFHNSRSRECEEKKENEKMEKNQQKNVGVKSLRLSSQFQYCDFNFNHQKW